MMEEYPPLNEMDVGKPKYLEYDRFTGFSILDTVYSKAAIPLIESAIRSRNAPIQIAFVQGYQWSKIGRQPLKKYPFGHAEIWFGNNVGRVSQFDVGTYIATLKHSEMAKQGFETITLPCKDPVAVFRVINELIDHEACHRIGYGGYLLKLANHLVAQALDVDDLVEARHPDDELDPLDPSQWTHGVFCSQLVLLYLKACVLKDAIAIEDPDARRRFLDTYTHTCTPSDLHRLVLATWVTPDKRACAPANGWFGTACCNNTPFHT
jgi:hypothetical protein